MGPGLAPRTQPALHSALQHISDGVPLVLALVPHQQLHSSMTPDLLVSALVRTPPSSTPSLTRLQTYRCPLLLAGDCECQRAAGHPQLAAL